MNRSSVKIHAPTLLLALMICILSSIPSLKQPDMGISMQDKLAHILEFGVFGFFLQRSACHLRGNRIRVYVIVFLIGSAYAGLDEIHQAFVAGRESEIGDFIADSAGILISQIFFFVLKRPEY